MSGAIGFPREWTFKIMWRPARSGASICICRSKRPGRSSAGSSTSGRLVAAIRMTPPRTSKPSISTSSWFSVCSRSSWPPPMPAPRWRPTASISSMKTIAGAFSLACSNRSRTRRGADTDEHLDEVRAGDRVERHGGLAGHRPREQGLAGAGRAVEQHALGDLGADGLELRGLLEELLDLAELLDGLVAAGDVGERRLRHVLGDQLGLGLAELHHAAAAAALHACSAATGRPGRSPRTAAPSNRNDPIRLGLGILELDFSMLPLATCSSTSLMMRCCWPATQYVETLSAAAVARRSRASPGSAGHRR